MTWKPRHEAHAIERVRVFFEFREPIPSKVLAKSSASITDKFAELGFDALEPAESSFTTIKVQLNAAPEKEVGSRNGFVLRRRQDGALAEEVGLRDLVFGYVTTTYGRWEAMKKRLEEVLLPVLDAVSEIVELDKIKLEYWDSFYFDGEPAKADVSKLVSSVDASIPADVRNGSSAWHSHIGWFEGEEAARILLNRNLDMVDRTEADGTVRRVLSIYTLVEKRSLVDALDLGSVRSQLDEMHKRSLQLFGGSLAEEYRAKVGIDLGAYK